MQGLTLTLQNGFCGSPVSGAEQAVAGQPFCKSPQVPPLAGLVQSSMHSHSGSGGAGVGGGEGGGGEGGGEGGGGEGGGEGCVAETTAHWPKMHTTASSRAMPCARGGGSSVRCLGHAVARVGCQAPHRFRGRPPTLGGGQRGKLKGGGGA